MSGSDALKDVLSSLDEAARASLLRRNPHLVEAYQREVERANQVDARVTIEASGAIVVSLDGMKLASELNERETWQARSARAKRQQRAVLGALANVARPTADWWRVCTTRVGLRLLDSDNLAGAAKHVRDAVATWLGTGDGVTSPVDWEVAQRKAKTYGCIVRIEPVVRGNR